MSETKNNKMMQIVMMMTVLAISLSFVGASNYGGAGLPVCDIKETSAKSVRGELHH